MITNKNNITIKIFPVLMMLFWVGCEDLDFPDPNNPTASAADVQSLVTGAESGLRTDIGVYLRDVNVIGREAYYFEPADPRYTGELLVGPVDGGGFLCTRPWNSNYKVIQNCLLLAESGDAGASGVGKTFHAYALMRVMSLWAENGARLNYDGEMNTAVATEDQVWDEIESLLDEGSSNFRSLYLDDQPIPEVIPGVTFTFSLSTGFDGFDTPETFDQFNRALRARVAVLQDDWLTASTALENSFLDESGDMNLGAYHTFSSGANDQTNEMYEAYDGTTIKLYVHPSYATDAEPGDTRYTSKVHERENSSGLVDGLQSNLAPMLWTSSYDNVPIIRNEELILLKAEVDIAGSASGGVNEINIVRNAHGLSNVESGGLDRLLYEKRYSLLLEGQRLQDMRHYGKLGDLPLDRDGDAVVTFPIPTTETEG